jgi:hypothetical protein
LIADIDASLENLAREVVQGQSFGGICKVPSIEEKRRLGAGLLIVQNRRLQWSGPAVSPNKRIAAEFSAGRGKPREAAPSPMSRD